MLEQQTNSQVGKDTTEADEGMKRILLSCGGRGGHTGGEEVINSGSLPAVLEVRGRVEGASLRLSDRKSSMEGLSRGRLSCCSPTSWRPETPSQSTENTMMRTTDCSNRNV